MIGAHLLVLASFLSGVAIPIGRFAVRPEQVAGPLVLLAVLARRRVGRAPPVAALVVGWLAAGVFGAFGEPDTARALEHAARLVATALPVLLLPLLLDGRDRAERAWDGFLWMAAACSLAGLGALAAHAAADTSWGTTRMPRLGYVHAQGPLLEPNVLGALAAAAGLCFLLRVLAPLPAPRRLAAAAGLALCAAGVLVSVTRAAWIAPPVAFAVLALLDPRVAGERWTRARLAAAGMLVLSAGTLAVAFTAPALDVSARTGLAGKVASFARLGEDPNVAVRLRSYDAALTLFRDAPLLGAGHGAMERLPGAEDRDLRWAGNLEVHLLADTGLAGFLCLATLVAAALARTWRGARRARSPEERRRHLERLGALVVLLVAAQATETSWLASFWVLFGLAFAATPVEPDPVPRRRKLLYVHPSDELYGSDRVLLELVRRLDRERFEPEVLLSSDLPYAGRLTRRLLELGIPVRRLRIGVVRRRALATPAAALRFALDTLVSTVRIARLLSRERFDLVHANTVTVLPAAFGAALSGVPLVWHVHEIVTERPGRALLHGLVPALARRVVVVSEAARQALGHDGAEVIPNGVEARPRAPLPAGPARVVYVGRLSARKGPDVLLEAMARLAEAHPEASLVFAGDEFGGGGDLRERLVESVERLGLDGRVVFQPFDEDVRPLLASARVVVSPSVQPESFGLALLEAMASGRAVVASDLGGPRELVAHGVSGYLVPPGDTAALASALDPLLADAALALSLGDAGRERALAHFDIRRTVERFEALYEEVAPAR